MVRRQGRETVSGPVRERSARVPGPADGTPRRAVDGLLRGRRPAGVGRQQRAVVRVPGGPAPITALEDIRSYHVCHEPRCRHPEQRKWTIKRAFFFTRVKSRAVGRRQRGLRIKCKF